MPLRQSILIASGVCGIFAAIGSVLFSFAGAGLAGSPFQGDDYHDWTLLWVLILGPLSVLPCTILDYFKPGRGGLLLCCCAIADVIAIVLNNIREWGFAIHGAGLGSFCLALPVFIFGTVLFLSSDQLNRRLRIIWWIELLIATIPAVFFSWHVGADGLSSLIAFLRNGTV